MMGIAMEILAVMAVLSLMATVPTEAVLLEGDYCEPNLGDVCPKGLICQDPKNPGLDMNSCPPKICTCEVVSVADCQCNDDGRQINSFYGDWCYLQESPCKMLTDTITSDDSNWILCSYNGQQQVNCGATTGGDCQCNGGRQINSVDGDWCYLLESPCKMLTDTTTSDDWTWVRCSHNGQKQVHCAECKAELFRGNIGDSTWEMCGCAAGYIDQMCPVDDHCNGTESNYISSAALYGENCKFDFFDIFGDTVCTYFMPENETSFDWSSNSFQSTCWRGFVASYYIASEMHEHVQIKQQCCLTTNTIF